MKSLIVTGAAGFIGSSFVRLALDAGYRICVIDKLTYAGHKANLEPLLSEGKIEFVHADICNSEVVTQLFKKHQPSALVNFAAESHVDNSITNPGAFVETNVLGVLNLLQCANTYFKTLDSSRKSAFRFVQVSTDEVYGQLGAEGYFSEATPYAPNSPYSASKAGGDLLVRAWHHTYKLPTITTNCSNNYGPRQFPEKLIPLMISHCLEGKTLPVYGNGSNIRDWIYVDDHSRGVMLALEKGKVGETYCFGGRSERNNLDVVNAICSILDKKRPRAEDSYKSLISFVEDRLGHDFRYAIDDSKAQDELGFKREFNSFEAGLESTIDWYLNNRAWIDKVRNTTNKENK